MPDGVLATTREEITFSTRLPDALTGVWYPDDTEGAAGCRRYRALAGSPKGHDETVVVLVGSLVVTPDLIHVFAEYGEGDFHVVERVEPEGSDAWRVTARLGLDSMPDGQPGEDRTSSRLSLQSGKLEWMLPARLGSASSKYFRCDAVNPDIHPAVTEGTTTERMS